MKKFVYIPLLLLLAATLATAQRLPGDVAPTHYQLTLTPDLQKATFTGDEVIDVRVLKATPSITLNCAEITFTDATVTAGGSPQQANVTLNAEKETATLALAKPLAPGTAQIHIHYSGVLNEKMRGFYLTKTDKRNYAATQFESTDARRAYPSFDEPAYKATFDITLIVDKGDNGLANTKLVSDTPGPGEGKHTLKFATTPKMSSYLAAWAVGDFECESGEADGIPIRVCGTPDRKGMGGFALESAEHILHYYDQYFGIKYPYGKLDMLGLPDFAAGAMENTGLITYRDVLLFSDKNTSYELRKTIAQVVAHEMAHQWFGDLVTMKWWDDIWLNEGFATWMTNKPLEQWKPEWNTQLDNVQEATQALRTDSLAATRPIRQPAETPSQIIELFDGIAYAKTASVLRMIESYVGPEDFRKGVNNYLAKHAYANATAEDFWTAIAQASHKPVDKIMPTFVDQAGAPLVTATASCTGGSAKVTIQQQRYAYDRSLFEKGSSELWQIPVCLKTASGEKKCELLTSREQSFTLNACSPWLYGNAGPSGYYRSGMEAAELRNIAADAEQKLNAGERIMLANDVWSLVRVNRAGIGDFLTLAEGLKADRTNAVVETVTNQLDYIGKYVVTNSDQPQYQAWVRSLLRPAYRELGWEAKPSDTEDTKAMRGHVLYSLAYTGRDPQVLSEARAMTDKYLAGQEVDMNILSTALRLAAFNGDAALYDKLLQKAKAAKSPEEYYNCLYVLADFTDPALVQRTMQLALSNDVRSQDTPQMMYIEFINPQGRELAWQFIRENWKAIQSKLNDGFSQGALVDAASQFCDGQSLGQVQQFFSENKVPAAERTLKQTLERVNYCIDLKSQQQQKLAAWLTQRGTSGEKAGGK